MKKLLFFLAFSLSLIGCSGRSAPPPPVVSSGIEGSFADTASIALTVDTNGEVHLSGGISIPTPIQGLISVNWLVGFDQVLNKAQQSPNMLYVLYDGGVGNVIQNEYNIGQPFKITFAENQWVRKIEQTGSGSIVVFVETVDSTISFDPAPQDPVDPPPAERPAFSSCPGAPPQRVVAGDKAYVSTKSDRLIVRKGPAKSEPQITQIVTGTNFLIVKGPICSDNWSWWRIRTPDGVVGWVSEGGDSIDPYFFSPR